MSIAPYITGTHHGKVVKETFYRSHSAEEIPVPWTRERLLAAQATRLLIRLDTELREARAQFNQDWFRRVMRARPRAIARLRRRWANINPPPLIPLGSLRRRFHPNLAW